MSIFRTRNACQPCWYYSLKNGHFRNQCSFQNCFLKFRLHLEALPSAWNTLPLEEHVHDYSCLLPCLCSFLLFEGTSIWLGPCCLVALMVRTHQAFVHLLFSYIICLTLEILVSSLCRSGCTLITLYLSTTVPHSRLVELHCWTVLK